MLLLMKNGALVRAKRMKLLVTLFASISRHKLVTLIQTVHSWMIPLVTTVQLTKTRLKLCLKSVFRLIRTPSGLNGPHAFPNVLLPIRLNSQLRQEHENVNLISLQSMMHAVTRKTIPTVLKRPKTVHQMSVKCARTLPTMLSALNDPIQFVSMRKRTESRRQHASVNLLTD